MNIKRLTAAVIVSAAAVTTTIFADSITVLLDGNPLAFETEPFISEGTTFVPMRAIFEALGAEVQWNGEERSVTSQKDSTEIKITIGSTAVYKNGEEETLLAAPVIVNDFTMVPLRFVSESFGCDVGWNAQKRTVVISTKNPLENTHIGFVGDSIAYGTNWEGGYAKLLSEKNNLTAYNEARGGSTIVRGVPWNEETTASRPSIIDLIDSLPDDLDYVIMEGGLNDYWAHVEMGTTDSTDEYTFAGALNGMFNKAKSKYPYAKLGFVITHNAFTYNAEPYYEEYYQMIKTICDLQGVPYLDLYSQNNTQTGVNVKDSEQKLKYFGSQGAPEGDGVHPNQLGYEEIYFLPMNDWLKTL